jgi:hypothetical protein
VAFKPSKYFSSFPDVFKEILAVQQLLLGETQYIDLFVLLRQGVEVRAKSTLHEHNFLRQCTKETYKGRPRWAIQSIWTTRNSDTLSSMAEYARQSKLMSVIGWKGRRDSFTTQLEGSNLMSGERNRKILAVKRNNKKIEMWGWSSRWRMRHSSVNKDHSPTFAPWVRTWGSSNDRRTNGHRPALCSIMMCFCGSRNSQSSFPAVRTPFPSWSTYWTGLFVFDDSMATLQHSLNLKERYSILHSQKWRSNRNLPFELPWSPSYKTLVDCYSLFWRTGPWSWIHEKQMLVSVGATWPAQCTPCQASPLAVWYCMGRTAIAHGLRLKAHALYHVLLVGYVLDLLAFQSVQNTRAGQCQEGGTL